MEKAWLYQLDKPFVYSHSAFNDIEFKNEWVTIIDSKMTISSGYAWDGCSPKYHVFGLFVVGTPDGILRHGKKWTNDASLVHDVLCQFRCELAITKNQSVKVFNDILDRDGWPLRKVYVKMVDRFGPQDWCDARS